MAENNGGSNVAFFLAGMGVGAVLALLFAPKSGKETREYIAQRAEESKGYMTAKGKEIRQQAEEAVEKAKDVVAKQKDQLSSALEAGKAAYREERGKAR